MGSMIGVIVTVVTLVAVGGSLFIMYKVFSGIAGKQQATQRLLATGIRGTARVLDIGATGTSMAVMGQRSVEIALTLEVSLPGRPPYMTQTTQFIPDIRLPSVQPGSMVQVAVDQMNPNLLAIADGMAGGGGLKGAGGPMMGGGSWGAAPGAPMIQPTAGAAPGGWGAPPPGAPPGAYGAPPGGMGAPMGMPMGMPMGGGFATPDMGKAMKRSMKMTIAILFITTVPIAIIMAVTFVDWSAFGIDLDGGSDDSGSGKKGDDEASGDIPKGGYCEGTVRCCKVVFNNAANANCDNWKNLPAAGCKSTWESYSQTAKSQGKTCK
jgi:hypothetical protein